MFKQIIAFCLCLLLIACGKVTQHNFEKITPNMSMKEVESILGTPTSAESVNIGGISGTSAVWKDNDVEISIQFLNDKVTVKSLSKGNDVKSSSEHTGT
jgi:hypothetical protein